MTQEKGTKKKGLKCFPSTVQWGQLFGPLSEAVSCSIWAASWQNQENGMCTQWRLRSAWASAQSDQSLRCPHKETLGLWLFLERTAKTLIRLGGSPGWSESSLGGSPGWSESSLGAKVILLVLSCGGSYCVCVCEQQRLWQNCLYVQGFLSFGYLPMW